MLTLGRQATVFMEMVNWCQWSPDQGQWPYNFLEFIGSREFERDHGPVDGREVMELFLKHYDEAEKCTEEYWKLVEDFDAGRPVPEESLDPERPEDGPIANAVIWLAERTIGAKVVPTWT